MPSFEVARVPQTDLNNALGCLKSSEEKLLEAESKCLDTEEKLRDEKSQRHDTETAMKALMEQVDRTTTSDEPIHDKVVPPTTEQEKADDGTTSGDATMAVDKGRRVNQSFGSRRRMLSKRSLKEAGPPDATSFDLFE